MKVNIKKADELRAMLKTKETLEEEQTVKFIEDVVADLENATQVAKDFVEAVVGPQVPIELLETVAGVLQVNGYKTEIKDEFNEKKDPKDESKTIKELKARVLKVSL